LSNLSRGSRRRPFALHAAECDAAHQLLNEVRHCREPSPDVPAICWIAFAASCVRELLSAERLHIVRKPIQPKGSTSVNEALVMPRRGGI